MIEHCVSTLKQKKQIEAEEKAFKTYVTDALMMIAENTTHYVGASEMFDYGKSFKERWIDLMNYEPPTKEEPEEEKSVKEFAADIWENMKKKKKKK